VEGIDDHAQVGVIGQLHHFPGLHVLVDVPAPGEGLEAHADAQRHRQVGQLGQVARDVGGVAAGVLRGRRAHQQQRCTDGLADLQQVLGDVDLVLVQGPCKPS
jgi:hypothetical protein